MTPHDREGLIAQIRHLRRVSERRDRETGNTTEAESERVRALEARVMHLEQMVEGLQDSVHRESDRHSRLIAELRHELTAGRPQR